MLWTKDTKPILQSIKDEEALSAIRLTFLTVPVYSSSKIHLRVAAPG